MNGDRAGLYLQRILNNIEKEAVWVEMITTRYILCERKTHAREVVDNEVIRSSEYVHGTHGRG